MSTASEMLLAGKIALVTGATSGIGLETASALAGLGVTVILGARNSSKAEDVAELIRKRHQGAQVEVGPELDLKSLDSVRNFAAEYEAKGKPLHILVNNAGANFSRPWRTAEEVTGLVQVNYLGAFALTRLMEKQLVSSAPARVVNVSSITHRFVKIPDVHEFLYNWKKGTYAHTKLANVLFSRELHKRLHSHGVDSCAVDPGGVNSSIWDRGGIFSRPPLRNVIHAVYAPPSDGAKSVVHAAVAPWTSKNKYDHYTFARGMFANPLVTWNRVRLVSSNTKIGRRAINFWGRGGWTERDTALQVIIGCYFLIPVLFLLISRDQGETAKANNFQCSDIRILCILISLLPRIRWRGGPSSVSYSTLPWDRVK
mmetsp:Transcript_21104/g.50393  ORF Transcript_21104/g.50393 Transcript_21104/m.50393 type:complete len:370 (-) Transcript_21104:2546-3655(-)